MVIVWGRERRRRWRQRSRHEQVEASTRWCLAGTPWVMFVGFVVPLPLQTEGGPLPQALVWTAYALTLAGCAVATRLLPRAVDAYLGAAVVTRAQLALLAGPLLVAAGALMWLFAVETGSGAQVPGLALGGAVAPFTLVFGLLVAPRTSAVVLGGVDVVALAVLAALGTSWPLLAASLVVLVLGELLFVFTGRSSAWYIAVLRELDEARDVQARFAVMEERLRFGRDLHDVLGRNLSAIALKSELAVQLAQRGAAAVGAVEAAGGTAAGRAWDTAVEQMTEVQRIARESQSEVRAVVRGYRDASLATELAGARDILRAAGIDCRIEDGEGADTGGGTGDGAGDGAGDRAGDGGELPAPVQAALGWVVREGATNVLRHADASRCTVRVDSGTAGASARLVIENDGAPAAPVDGWGGSGLRGLRERLAACGGTLSAERGSADGTFRLIAEVPRGAGR